MVSKGSFASRSLLLGSVRTRLVGFVTSPAVFKRFVIGFGSRVSLDRPRREIMGLVCCPREGVASVCCRTCRRYEERGSVRSPFSSSAPFGVCRLMESGRFHRECLLGGGRVKERVTIFLDGGSGEVVLCGLIQVFVEGILGSFPSGSPTLGAETCVLGTVTEGS